MIVSSNVSSGNFFLETNMLYSSKDAPRPILFNALNIVTEKTYEYIFNYTFVYAWAEILRKPIKIALKWIKQLYLTILSNLNVYTSHQNVIKLISKYFRKYFVLQK